MCLGALLLGSLLRPRVALADDCAETFASDRPAANNGHGVIGAGCADVEAGLQTDLTDAGGDLAFPTLLRVGLTQRFELRASTDLVRLSFPKGADVAASAPTALVGMKLTAVAAEKDRPGLGLLVMVGSVLNRSIGDQLTAQSALLFDWTFVPKLTLSLNGGLSLQPAPDDGARRRGRFDQVAVLTQGLPDLADFISLYVDAFGGVDLENGATFHENLGAGAAFLVAPQLQVDAYVFAELTGDIHPLSLGAGASFGF